MNDLENKDKTNSQNNTSIPIVDSDYQIKFIDSQEEVPHKIIIDTLLTESNYNQESDKDQIVLTENLKNPEKKEENFFEELFEDPKIKDIDVIIPIASNEILEINAVGDQEQQSHAELIQEIHEQTEKKLFLNNNISSIELPDQVLEETLISAIESEEHIAPPSIDIPRDIKKDVFKVKKGTKKAFFILKDMFGDIETEEDKKILEEFPTSPRRKLLGIFLALTLGFVGIHRLYFGHYKNVPMYALSTFFCYLSYELLPDRSLFSMLWITIFLWIIADVLAITFSRRIKDNKNRIIEKW